jgi:hypothetical protein
MSPAARGWLDPSGGASAALTVPSSAGPKRDADASAACLALTPFGRTAIRPPEGSEFVLPDAVARGLLTPAPAM